MKARILFVALFAALATLPLAAQSNKLIRDLENRRGELQQKIADTEELLNST